MNIISLFDGKACGRYALDQAGKVVNNYFASEIDLAAIKIAKKNWPDINHLGDIKNIEIYYDEYTDQTYIMSDVKDYIFTGKIDALIGGSPCQGFSYAGKQLNFNDPRSALFFEFARLYKKLKQINPDIKVFLENVKMKKEWQDVISIELGLEPIFIDSADYAPCTRKRLYWTNIDTKKLNKSDVSNILSDIVKDGYVDREKSYCIDANYWKGGNLNSYFTKRRRQLVFTDESMTKYRKLTPEECEQIHGLPIGYTEGVSNTQRYKMIGNGWECRTVTEIFKNLN